MKRYNKLPRGYSPVLTHVFDFSDWNTLYPSQYLSSFSSLGDMIFPESINYLSSHPSPVVYPSCRINDLTYYLLSYSDPLHLGIFYAIRNYSINHKEFVTLLSCPRLYILNLLLPFYSFSRSVSLDYSSDFLDDFLRGRSRSLLIGDYSDYICRMSFSSLNLNSSLRVKYTLYRPGRKNVIPFSD